MPLEAVLLSIGAGIAASALMWGMVALFFGPRMSPTELELLGPADFGQDAPADSERGVRTRVLDTIGRISDKRGFTGYIAVRLTRAGIAMRTSEFIYLHLLTAIAIGVATQLLSRSILLSGVAIFIVAVVPFMSFHMLANRRKDAFEAQLPGVLDLIAGSLRAGWGVQQAIGLVVEEIPEPAHGEFVRVQSQIRLGLSLEDALERMAERVGSRDFTWTVSVIKIQREVGGNLAEVLGTVAETIRERAALAGHVKSLTAEGRFTAWVLGLLPFALVGMLWVVGRDYLLRAFTSPLGIAAYLFAGLLLFVGILWLSKVVRVEA